MGENDNITLITDENFESEVEKSEKTVLIDFYADWCAPCRLISSMLDKIAEKFQDQLKVVKVDTENSPTVASKFKITGLPTLILFKDGVEKKRFVGVQKQSQIELNISELV